MKAIRGDITALEVDAIVNAANTSLLGGCGTGEAKLTRGCELLAKYVIHTVGPVWHGGDRKEPELLRNCYWNSLELARQKGLKSIAFPCVSTGVYGYPAEAAAAIAVKTADEFLKKTGYELEVIFCCYSRTDLDIYTALLRPG